MGPCVLAWRRAGRADCGLPSIVLVGCVCGLYKHIVRTNLRQNFVFADHSLLYSNHATATLKITLKPAEHLAIPDSSSPTMEAGQDQQRAAGLRTRSTSVSIAKGAPAPAASSAHPTSPNATASILRANSRTASRGRHTTSSPPLLSRLLSSSKLELESPGGSTGQNTARAARQPLLSLLERAQSPTTSAEDASKEGFFGSIRFPSAGAGSIPSKFVRLRSAHDYASPQQSVGYAKLVVDLAINTWKLAPPCAMISIPDAGRSPAKLSANTRLDLVIRRGIAEAAHRTGAWIFTGGSTDDAGAHVAGRAMVHLSNEHGESERLPVIGIVPWAACRCSETLATLPNGFCWQYQGGLALADGEDLQHTSQKAASLVNDVIQPIELDVQHSHFLMVDGPPENADLLRGTIEKYISDTDVSNDNIQTPKVVLCIAGGASVFKHIRDQLDANDASTGTAVPVLVLADSGGAAEDIYNYFMNEVLPQQDDDERDAEYVREGEKWLPDIKTLGKMTGQNSREQLAFFRLSDDLEARDNLALEIQKALLNDCPYVR